MKMPFGRHKGVELPEIPDDYLRWLYCEADLFGALEDAVNDEYWRRFGDSKPKEVTVPVLPLSAMQRDVARKVIDAGYRHLAMKNHPDIGGDHRAMVAINETVELLRRGVGGAS